MREADAVAEIDCEAIDRYIFIYEQKQITHIDRTRDHSGRFARIYILFEIAYLNLLSCASLPRVASNALNIINNYY